jgi:hypothetical protein
MVIQQTNLVSSPFFNTDPLPGCKKSPHPLFYLSNYQSPEINLGQLVVADRFKHKKMFWKDVPVTFLRIAGASIYKALKIKWKICGIYQSLHLLIDSLYLFFLASFESGNPLRNLHLLHDLLYLDTPLRFTSIFSNRVLPPFLITFCGRLQCDK